MTKREMYNEILKIAAVAENEEMVNFINHELELLNRKNTSIKPTKRQLENEELKKAILTALENVAEPVTIKELCEICEPIRELSNQRITHLLTALRNEEKVERTYNKKVPYFALTA